MVQVDVQFQARVSVKFESNLSYAPKYRGRTTSPYKNCMQAGRIDSGQWTNAHQPERTWQLLLKFATNLEMFDGFRIDPMDVDDSKVRTQP